MTAHQPELEAPSVAGEVDGQPPRGTTITPGDLVRIARLFTRIVDGCDHATVIVIPSRGVEMVGASDAVAQRAGALMVATRDVPIPRLLQEGEAIDAPDLTGTTDWPPVAQALVEQVGVRGMVGRRLMAGRRRVGYVALWSDEAGALADVEVSHLHTLTSMLAGWVVSHEATAEVRTLQRALDSARTIGRALGLVMAERRVSTEAAMTHLRALSNATNVRLRELAQAMVSSHDEAVGGKVAPGEVARTEAIAADPEQDETRTG